MANKFYVWCENINNVENSTTFGSDEERSTGFIGGTPARSTKVNTALRQANLIGCALIDLFIPNDTTLGVESTRSALSSSLETAFSSKVQGITVNNATNVTTNINGKAITTIFESNGTTVKNATNATNATSATNATNVTTNINGKPISSIFESNGTTVKSAYYARILQGDNVGSISADDITIIRTWTFTNAGDLYNFIRKGNTTCNTLYVEFSYGNVTNAQEKKMTLTSSSSSHTFTTNNTATIYMRPTERFYIGDNNSDSGNNDIYLFNKVGTSSHLILISGSNITVSESTSYINYYNSNEFNYVYRIKDINNFVSSAHPATVYYYNVPTT